MNVSCHEYNQNAKRSDPNKQTIYINIVFAGYNF